MSATADSKVDPSAAVPGSTDTPQLPAVSAPSEAVDASIPTSHPEGQAPGSVDADSADVGDNTTLAPASQQSPVEAAPSASASPEGPDEAKAAATAQKPSSQTSDEAAKDEEDSGPSLMITLLLITGSRHPFKIDGKYLRKRSVKVENNDPFAMSVYTLKELIWREWRQDWEPRPSSPSSIRLISMGKLLDDKAPLSDSKFNHDSPTVVHMTVKPQDLVDEEDAKGSKAQYSRERESSERSPSCRCIIQ
ncbi:ubiquitin-like protein [Aspergillus heteromorphus CBS 117.55]|uniref:Ubiquitin-like protein n=1 Tax=Aspergillus heteromorphus CBS 117.55 TaxID=1448321 RepID=A0A317VY25_9EURO|nr:ubiquitin-like protein [Aspergillus heteromorphus CBS 117.55]PWY79276.1 ubiquitin-like protein [Aspergillus heteromorphus CBS 117.55]